MNTQPSLINDAAMLIEEAAQELAFVRSPGTTLEDAMIYLSCGFEQLRTARELLAEAEALSRAPGNPKSKI